MILKVMLAYADQTSNLSVVYQMKSCCCHICIHCLTCCWLLVCLFFSYVAVRRSVCVHRFYALKALPRLGLVSILCGKVSYVPKHSLPYKVLSLYRGDEFSILRVFVSQANSYNAHFFFTFFFFIADSFFFLFAFFLGPYSERNFF